ncbi:MAG: succinyldiaminopimelate transaminase [Pseudomonadota bacterium]
MNPDLDRLQSYPFERLAVLKAGLMPPAHLPHIALSIGEPQHPTPGFIVEEALSHLHSLSSYPTTRGTVALREAIRDWLTWRFGLPAGAIDIDHHILPVNGTREALFAVAQALVDRTRQPRVLMPNPFYQIYEGAAFLAGAEPYFLPCTEASGYLPDDTQVPDAIWRRCQLLYLCSPGNPTGAVIGLDTLRELIGKARQYGFVIAADECYSELYDPAGSPPPGLLQAANSLGSGDFSRCLVFHSLSKRSSVPGMRSGFVAGDAGLIERFFRYRTYHGCAMPLHHQAASTRAWRDETHVEHNRCLYQAKFEAVIPILSEVLAVPNPQAGFYLWPKTPIADTDFARGLFATQHVTVLPGSFLSRDGEAGNPGRQRVRLALVAPLEECIEAAHRIRAYVAGL